jgi:hypothetical protein
MEKEILTQKEVREILGNISRTTLYRYRCQGLKYYSKGRFNYFLKSDIIKFLTK